MATFVVVLIPSLLSFSITAVRTVFDVACLVKDISCIVYNGVMSRYTPQTAIKDKQTEFVVVENNKKIGIARVHIILDDVLPNPDKQNIPVHL